MLGNILEVPGTLDDQSVLVLVQEAVSREDSSPRLPLRIVRVMGQLPERRHNLIKK